jgi:hypothetical protein
MNVHLGQDIFQALMELSEVAGVSANEIVNIALRDYLVRMGYDVRR